MKKLFLLLLLPLSLLGQGTKISDMTSATSLTGSEYVPIVQTTNKKATITLLRGWSSIGTASQLLRVNGSATGLEFFTPTWLTNPLTTTGDIIYSSSGTTGARLGIGGAGTFLRSDGSIPAWSTLTIPNTISALSIPVVNTANVLTSVTPSAGQSVRVNAGGTAWEAYTPGSGGITNSALSNELMMSNGTNAVSSGVFTTGAAGSIILGSASIGAGRQITVASSDTDANLLITAKGNTSLILGVSGTTSSTVSIGYAGGSLGVFSFTTNATANTLTAGNTEDAAEPFRIYGRDGTASTIAGASIELKGGNGTSGNANGGIVDLTGGSASGSGTPGYIKFNSGAQLKSYTVATLPTTLPQGSMAYVTDALAPTYLATIVGGGAVVCPVFYNGTNWVAM